MKEIKAFLETEYVLTMHNKDSCMGCYYIEDDWSIEIRGKNWKEIIDKAPYKMIESGIIQDRVELDKREVIEYNNKRVDYRILEDDYTQKGDADKVLRMILDSDLYKKLFEEKKQRLLKEEEAQIAVQRLEVEKREREEYERLKEKFKDEKWEMKLKDE